MLEPPASDEVTVPEPDAQSRQRVEERRERLRELMTELEQALAEPAARDAAAWRDGVRAVTDDLAEALDEHVEETERPNGLFDELTAIAPRLDERVGNLRGEHPRLIARLAALRAALDSDPSGPDPAAPARIAGVALLGELFRHRQAGADLLYEAYWVDVSTGD